MVRRFLQGGTNYINIWQILLDTQGTFVDARSKILLTVNS